MKDRLGTTSSAERHEDLKARVTLPSVAIQRIIDEVKADKDAPLHNYNRVYHRHNR